MAIADHYRRDAVMTARPDQLVTMLYDRLLQAIGRARTQLETDGDPAAVHHELVVGQRILTELRVTLDAERGGELAANLGRLYDYCAEQLVAANMSKLVSDLDGAESVIREIREAWVAAANEVHST